MVNDPIASDRSRFISGIGYALLATLLWSGNFIVARAMNQSISPITLSFLRWAIATLFLMPFAISGFVKEWKTIRMHLRLLLCTALTGVTLFNTFIYIAGRYASATNLALIGTTAAPVFVLLISGLFLRIKITGMQVTGAICCIAGILILITKGHMEQLAHFRLTYGDTWILLAALSFALYTILVRRKPGITPLTFLFTVFLFGTLLLLPLFMVQLYYGIGFRVEIITLGVLLYLGIGASVIAFLSWNHCIRKIGPARTALFGNFIPIFSSIEASLFLHEPFTMVNILSLLTIMAGLLIANINALKISLKQTGHASGK